VDLLAATTGELRLAVPDWGSVLLALVGLAYLMFGSARPRLFDVLSMTVLGCMVGLVACPWIPLWQPAVIIIGGLVLGGLAALFRNVCHALLSAAVMAGVLASLAALAVGPRGFVSYLAVNLSNRSYSVQISGPNLACDPVLAAGVVGLLAGATVAVWQLAFSGRLTTSAQGAALIVAGMASLITTYRGEGQPSVATAFPLTVGALWLCLVVIGLLAQAEVARRRSQWEETDLPPDLEEP
jgi:hypothetical protein